MDQQTTKKRSWIRIIGWVAIALVVFVLVMSLGIYRFGWQGGFVDGFTSIVPLPVSIVDYHVITISDFNKRLDAYKKAVEYNQDFDFSDPQNAEVLSEQKQLLLDRMIELSLIESIAKKKGISITQKEIDQNLDLIARQSGTEMEDFDIILNNVYGLGRDEFIEQVVRPSIYETQLQLFLNSNEQENTEAYQKAREILGKLSAGENFSDIAKEYSDDFSNSELGGDLGWAPRDFFVKSFEDAVFEMEPGEISEIIPTQFGLHIVEMLERTEDEEGTVLVHPRHILIVAKDFYTWLNEQKSQVSVWKFSVK